MESMEVHGVFGVFPEKRSLHGSPWPSMVRAVDLTE
jgi:hypothetical protein